MSSGCAYVRRYHLCFYIPPSPIVWTFPECCPGDEWSQCCRSFNCPYSPDFFSIITPRWFILHIDIPGMLMMELTLLTYSGSAQIIRHPDAFLYGPFDTPTRACLAGLVDSTLVDCFIWTFFPDTLVIPYAQTGEFYLLNISAPSDPQSETIYSFSLLHYGEPGCATLDCNMMIFCAITAVTAQPTDCNPQSNTFTLSGQVYFVHPPQTGNLVV